MTAAEFKKMLRKLGVKVRTQQTSTGIIVAAPAYEIVPSRDEQRIIQTLAKQNGFSLVQGMEIDPEQYRECLGISWEFFRS